jgi:putative addiction module killer protein
MVRIGYFTTVTGESPFAKWRETLDNVTRARVMLSVLRLEAGNFSTAKGVGAGLFELRLDFGPGYRVYFGRDGEELVILVGGGSKKREQRDIDSARLLWREYKRLKGTGTGYVKFENKTV